MYQGAKDARIQIEIAQEFCYERMMNGVKFIEVRIPTKTIPMTDGISYVHWKSFMVAPEQVYYKNNEYNIIDGICADTGIVVCCHYYEANNVYKPDMRTSETLDPYEIIRRIHQYNI